MTIFFKYNLSLEFDTDTSIKQPVVIEGINYVESECCGLVPPWDECPASCKLDAEAVKHLKSIWY